MIVRAYRDSDYKEMASWYTMRGITPISEKSLPFVGFIVPGVAALFVYDTDSNLQLMEGLISNPKCSSEERNEAINAVEKECYDAVVADKKIPILLIRDDSTINRVKGLGYEELGTYKLFTKRG